MTTASIGKSDLARLVRGEHHQPHRVLGPHPQDGQVVIRAWRPDATAVAALVGTDRVELDRVHPAGLFEGAVARSRVPAYQLEVSYPSGTYTLGGGRWGRARSRDATAGAAATSPSRSSASRPGCG